MLPAEERRNTVMRILYPLYLLSFVWVWPLRLHAGDEGSWTRTHFNSENGLPQNSVTYAQMDDDGYLWLATQAGIVRYDGQRFRLYDDTNSSLLRNRYFMLAKTARGVFTAWTTI